MENTNENRPYELQEYNPEWKEMFNERSIKIKPLFKENLVSIEHIGSTSIEGMTAKPNIDILVVVKNLDSVTEQLQFFVEAGYSPQGREYVGGGDEYITQDTLDGKRITSIHVLQTGNPKIKSYREFREYLKINEPDRKMYIDLKKKLYSENPKNYKAYNTGKTETIAEIKERARVWSERFNLENQ